MTTPEEVMTNVLDGIDWYEASMEYVAEAILAALDTAGYKVVPSHRVIPEGKIHVHVNQPAPLPYVHPDPFDPMS